MRPTSSSGLRWRSRLRPSRLFFTWRGLRGGRWRRLSPGNMDLGRAKWGAGGTLHRQSALAGPNSRAEVWVLSLAAANGVESRDLRSSGLRTPSGPEGSSGKEKLEGAAAIRAGAVDRGASWESSIEAGVRGHLRIHA